MDSVVAGATGVKSKERLARSILAMPKTAR